MFRFWVRLCIPIALFILVGTALGQGQLNPKWSAGDYNYAGIDGDFLPLGLQYSSDGSKLLVSSNYNFPFFEVFDMVKHSRIMKQFMVPSDYNHAAPLCFSADSGSVYVSTSSLGAPGFTETIQKYDLSTGQLSTILSYLYTDNSQVSYLSASPDGKYLLYVVTNTGSADRVNLYDLAESRVTTSFNFQPIVNNAVASVAWIANSSQLVFNGPTIYDLTGTRLAAKANANGPYPVSVSPDQNSLLGYNPKFGFVCYSTSNLAVKWQSGFSNYDPYSCAFSSDNTAVLFPGLTGSDTLYWTVSAVSAKTGAPLSGQMVSPYSTALNFNPGVTVSPTSNQLVMGPNLDFDCTLEVWNFDSTTGGGQQDGNLVRGSFVGGGTGNLTGGNLNPFTTSMNGKSVSAFAGVAGSVAGNVFTSLLNSSSGVELAEIPGACQLSPDGKYYIQSNAPTGTTPSSHLEGFQVFSTASNKLLASVSSSSTWNATWGPTSGYIIEQLNSPTILRFIIYKFDGQTLKVMTMKDGGAAANALSGTCIVMTPDGSKVVAYPGGNTVTIYNLPSGTVAATIQGLSTDVPSDFGNTFKDLSVAAGNLLCTNEEMKTTSASGQPVYQQFCRVFNISGATPALVKQITCPSTSTVSGSMDAEISPDGHFVGFYTGDFVEPYAYESKEQIARVSDGKVLENWQGQIPLLLGLPTLKFSSDSTTMAWTSFTDGTIVAADVDRYIAAVTIAPSQLAGGGIATGMVSLNAPASTSVTVSLSTTATGLTIPKSVIVPAGQASANFTIGTSGVDAATIDTIVATYEGASASGTFTVEPATTLAVSFNPSTITGGASSTGTVTLNAPAGPSGVSATLSSSNANLVVPTTTSVTVPAGKSSATFVVNAFSPVATSAAQVTAKTTSYSGSATLTVNPVVMTLTLDKTTLIGGNAVLMTVTLAQPAPSSLTFSLQSSSAAVAVPQTITIAKGQSTMSVGLATNPVAANTKVTVSLLSGPTTLSSAGTTVLAPVVTDVIPTVSTAVGAQTQTALVLFSGPVPKGTSIRATSSNPAIRIPASIPIPAGADYALVDFNIAAVTVQTSVVVDIGGLKFTIVLYP